MTDGIFGLVIPKYGMVMTEGRIASWHVAVGDQVKEGDEIVDIETEKVANVYESNCRGILRRKLVAEGDSLPIGALFGVISLPEIQDDEIDAFVVQFQSAFSAATEVTGGPATETAEIPGGHIRFLKQGDSDGTPIVLVHGFGGDLSSWILNQGALAETHSVYAIDLPGHGGSVKDPAVATLEALATSLIAFLDERGLSRVHLVGHSLGGAVVVKAAVKRPQQIASLMLLAPVGLGPEINQTFIEGMIEADRRKEMHAVLQTLFHNQQLVTRDMTMNVLKAKRIDGALSCLRSIAASSLGDLQAVNLRRDLASLSIPVQIIWGDSDRIIPVQDASYLPQPVSLHVVEKAGHMPHMEKATEFNGIVRRFIEATA